MTTKKPPAVDWFNILFFRLEQLVGLALVIYEVVIRQHAQFSVLLFASAMMLGPTGLKLILKGAAGASAAVKGTNDE